MWQRVKAQQNDPACHDFRVSRVTKVTLDRANCGESARSTARWGMSSRKQSNQRRILHGATYLLESGSWDGFTVDSLARYLKMSKSTLYRYFVSKERVVDTLVGELCGALDADLQRIAQDASSSADVEFGRFIEVYATFADDVPRTVVLERTELPVSTQARLVVTRIHIDSACARILRLGRAQGQLLLDDPTITATGFVAALEAVLQFTARREDIHSRSGPIRDMAEVLLGGLMLPAERSRRTLARR